MDFNSELSARLEQKKLNELEQRRRQAQEHAEKQLEWQLEKELSNEKKHRDAQLFGDAPEEVFRGNQLTGMKQFYEIMLENNFKGSTKLSLKSDQRSLFRARKLTRGYMIGTNAYRINEGHRVTVPKAIAPNLNKMVYLCEDYRIRDGDGKSILGDTFTPGRIETVTEHRKDWINGSDSPNAVKTVTTRFFIAENIEDVLLKIAVENLDK